MVDACYALKTCLGEDFLIELQEGTGIHLEREDIFTLELAGDFSAELLAILNKDTDAVYYALLDFLNAVAGSEYSVHLLYVGGIVVLGALDDYCKISHIVVKS